MKYILKSCKEIFITYILNYLIIIITGIIYNQFGYDDLNFLINNILPIILLIFYIITIIYLYKNNCLKEEKLNTKYYFPLILLGISLAISLNMLIFLKYPPKTILKPTIITIISSGIIGPIYEELLFRYILYNRLKKKYSIKKSLLITTIIFALIHLSPIKIIYAFILGLVINITYEKYKNILSPILIHTSANIIVIFLTEYNTYILLLSLSCLVLGIIINTKNKSDKILVKKSN